MKLILALILQYTNAKYYFVSPVTVSKTRQVIDADGFEGTVNVVVPYIPYGTLVR